MPPTARTTPARKQADITFRLSLVGLAFLLCVSTARGQSPNPTPVVAPPPPGAADSAAAALYQRALAARAQARAHNNEAAARKAGVEDLQRLLSEYPNSSSADDAALMLIEDGFCLTDAGFPDCLALTIRGYEAFLAAYPNSDRRPQALKLLAAHYLDLSFRYEQAKPWQSAEKAELCLGRALQLAELLAAGAGPEAAFGRELAGRIRASGKAFSIVPGIGMR